MGLPPVSSRQQITDALGQLVRSLKRAAELADELSEAKGTVLAAGTDNDAGVQHVAAIAQRRERDLVDAQKATRAAARALFAATAEAEFTATSARTTGRSCLSPPQ